MEEKTYLSEEIKKRIYLHNQKNPYTDVLPFELNIRYPKINYDGFFPQKGEAIIYAALAIEFEDKEKVVGYTGKSSGASVRVAKGLTLHTGGRGGKAIRENVRETTSGDYILTNKRVIFIANNKGFEYKLDKITAVKPTGSNTLYIQAGKTIKNILFDENCFLYALSLTQFAIEQYIAGKDLYDDLTNSCSEEESKKIEEARSYINAGKYLYGNRKSTKNDKKKGKFGKTLLKILIGIIIIMMIKPLFSGTTTKSKVKVEKPTIGIEQVLKMEDHPRILDDIEYVKTYYEGFNNDKIIVTDGYKYANIYTMDKWLLGVEDSELYFVEDSSSHQYLDFISFALNEKQVEGLNLEKCLKIVNQYLPKHFYDVYKLDFSYMKEDEGLVIYTYMVKEKDNLPKEIDGIDISEYPSFYMINISTEKDNPNNTWTISTEYRMFQDQDKEWIERNAKPWKVNLQDYN